MVCMTALLLIIADDVSASISICTYIYKEN
jgi:hypothetical protein